MRFILVYNAIKALRNNYSYKYLIITVKEIPNSMVNLSNKLAILKSLLVFARIVWINNIIRGKTTKPKI